MSFGNSITSAQCRNTLHTLCTDKRCACRCHNPDQGDLFEDLSRESGQPTIEQAEAARDEAVARVEEHADAAWMAEAQRYLDNRILSGYPFTTDDLWDDGLPKPREPRAMGPVILRAVRSGAIIDTGEMRKSKYRHATKITVWRGA